MSNKINYDVLRSLTSSTDGSTSLLPGSEEGNVTTVEPVTVIESGPVVPPSRKRHVTESDADDASVAPSASKKTKSVKIKAEMKPNTGNIVINNSKKVQITQREELPSAEESLPLTSEVVIESGPVEVEDYDDESK